MTSPDKPNLVLANASPDTKIRHRNPINHTIAGMPLAARRVLYLMLAQFDPKKPLGRDIVFVVTAEEYSDLCRIGRNSAAKQLRAAAIELQHQVIEIPKEDLLPLIPRAEDMGDLADQVRHGKTIGINEPMHRMFNVTHWVDYAYNSGYIEVCPSRQMEPYIAHLSSDYTSQTLMSAVRLTTRNTANLYQFLRESMCTPAHPQYIDTSIDELKDRLRLYRLRYNKKIYHYPRYPDFKRDVINVAVRSINELTELDVTASVAKKIGRRAHILRFSYTERKQRNLNL